MSNDNGNGNGNGNGSSNGDAGSLTNENPQGVPTLLEHPSLAEAIVYQTQWMCLMMEQRNDRGAPRYGDFTRTNPPVFSEAKEPMDAANWIQAMEDKFDILRVAKAGKVTFAASQLQGIAASWWITFKATRAEGSPPLTWREFATAFRANFIPLFSSPRTSPSPRRASSAPLCSARSPPGRHRSAQAEPPRRPYSRQEEEEEERNVQGKLTIALELYLTDPESRSQRVNLERTPSSSTSTSHVVTVDSSLSLVSPPASRTVWCPSPFPLGRFGGLV